MKLTTLLNRLRMYRPGMYVVSMFVLNMHILSLFSIPMMQAKAEHFRLSMLAHYEQRQHKPQQAFSLYQQLLSNATSPHAYSSYIRFLAETGNVAPIIALIPQLDAPLANNVEVQLTFALALAHTGKTQEASKRFVTLQQQYPAHRELTYYAAQTLGPSNPKQAITIIDNYLNSAPPQPQHCVFHFLQSQLYQALNNPDKALEEVKKSTELCPRLDKGWLMRGMLEEQKGNINQAVTGYSTYLTLVGSHKDIEQHLHNLMVKAKVQSPTPNKPAFDAPSPACMTNALTWYENKEYARALQALDTCLEQYPDHQEAKLFKLHVLSSMGQIDRLLELLRTWIEQDLDQDTWYHTLHLLVQGGLPAARAVTLLQSLEQAHPKALRPILYLADMLSRTGQLAQALAYHDKATALTNDALLRQKIIFNRAALAYDHQAHSHLKQSIDQALALGPTFPPLLNFLAYYFATDGKDLTRAQHFVNQALVHDKDNPHFLDTQAIIWYKQQAYQKAATLLTSLVQEEPKDYSIRLHLGKTYYKLGNSKQGQAEIRIAQKLAHTQREHSLCATLLKQHA